MNLGKKKALAARTLRVGAGRIEFVKPRLEEIKEVITKQDIRDLHKDGAIIIRDIKGRKKKGRKKKRRSTGSVRKKINKRKEEYMKLTRKLRKYVSDLKGKLTENERKDIRKKIRNKYFKSKTHLREYIGGLER